MRAARELALIRRAVTRVIVGVDMHTSAPTSVPLIYGLAVTVHCIDLR
jgi:hypothetical protein